MRTSYLSPPTRGVCVWRSNQGPGARDLSRRNAGTADPRWRISRPLRYPTFLRTEVRAPFARAGTTLNRYTRRRGLGRGGRWGPLSPALSPLVPRGERGSLASTASSYLVSSRSHIGIRRQSPEV